MHEAARFGLLPVDTPQEDIQRLLQEVHRSSGLPAALDCLYAFQLRTGYITRQKLEEVERLSFPDPETGLSFRIQVNYARTRYSPTAGAGSPEPGRAAPGAESSGKPTEPAGRAMKEGAEQLPRNRPSPPCLLCKENVGRPGKEGLRIYEFPLDARGRRYFVQLTPFPLFPRHFVLISNEHRPQKIDGQTVPDMLSFLRSAPGYTVCSNSDVEWAGSSILDHLHFQVFADLSLPVMRARPLPGIRGSSGGCSIEALHYPLSAVRLSATEERPLRDLAGALIERWKGEDPGRNTVNLVLVRVREAERSLQLVVLFRNPDFRTPPGLRRFKSEGVGVIEASGEAILPVPEGEDAGELWRSIRAEGLRIATGIIRGNSPGLSEQRLQELIDAAVRQGTGGREAGGEGRSAEAPSEA
jgi:UDPglucose--hexose-1-phosphate uridylyltransferase